MTVIYVSGPMTGLRDFNRPAFNAAAEQLLAAGYEVRNPAVLGAPAEGDADAHPYEWYLKRAVALMLEADAVGVLPGWHASRGARVEIDLATTLRMPVMTCDLWLSREPSDPLPSAAAGPVLSVADRLAAP